MTAGKTGRLTLPKDRRQTLQEDRRQTLQTLQHRQWQCPRLLDASMAVYLMGATWERQGSAQPSPA